MFDILKKKISGFIDNLTKKEETKAEIPPEAAAEAPTEIPRPPPKVPEKEIVPPAKVEQPKPEPEKTERPKPEKAKAEKPKPVPIETSKPAPKEAAKPAPSPSKEITKPSSAIQKEIPKPAAKMPPKEEPRPALKEAPKPEPIREKAPEPGLKPVQKEAPKPERKAEPKPAQKTEPPKPAIPEFRPGKPEGEKAQVRLSPLKAIKSFITREVEISESDVRGLLESLELELLEGDVELGVAESIRQELERKLVGQKVDKGRLNDFIRDSIRGTLLDTMSSERDFDLLELIESREKPVKIVFLGINGAGKTTTIAKVAYMLMQHNRKVAFAAADTFRAAAIEQMEVHAERLGVRIVKRDYGADPTSVAFDAVAYAKAHGIDAVLIDTAGRQDTNVNLINELKKMSRVIQPDLKIYIGESIAGSSIIEQVSAFDREIGVDGVILTKLDCDPKGGTVLSITKATGIPVIYVGTGQKYEDIERFDPGKIVDRMLS